jgi:catechol 2,3-dioxygenase-like lactoylglutathione lyase family enzyme
MVLPPPSPAFRSIAPRFVVPDLERAFAFYERLGFRTADYGSIAIIERDGVELQFNHDPDLAPGRHFVCYITVTASAALYQQYVRDLPAGSVRSPLTVTDYGTREFWVCDPFNNILIFSEPLDAQGDAQEQG